MLEEAVVIAGHDPRADIGLCADAGVAGVGTIVAPRAQRISARKLWIAFAIESAGRIVVDEGARRALLDRGVSLLPAGVVAVEGSFQADQGVEVAGPDGAVFAKGLARTGAEDLRSVAGSRTVDLPEGMVHEVIHRDDLVIVP